MTALVRRRVGHGAMACLLTLAFLASFPSPSAASSDLAAFDVVYGTLGNSGPNAGSLITVSATGAGALVGSTGIVGDFGDAGVPALAIKSTGEMFALDIRSSAKLYRLNAGTGAATLVATTNLSLPTALACGADDDLYAVDGGGRLHALDAATGATMLRGATGASIKGLAFDPTDGVLWGSDGSGQIFTIDLLTGAAALVGSTGRAPSPDIYFDRDGNLFGSSGGGVASSNLIRIDKVTGAGTIVGPIGFPSVSGMAVRLEAPIPTPVLVSIVGAHMDGDAVVLEWYTAERGADIYHLERSSDGASWARIADLEVDSRGHIRYRDRAVRAGHAYAYRLAANGEGVSKVTEAFWFEVPGRQLSLGMPNPASGEKVMVEFVLADQIHDGRLELWDVSGRRLRVVDLSSFGPGMHSVDLVQGERLPMGLYWVRLRHGVGQISRKLSIAN